MKRDVASTIFRTVVFAGAMLGAGCSKKQPTTTPTNTAPGGDAQMQGDPSKETAKPDGANPCGGDPCGSDPCAGGERPRGTDDDGGGGTGRGFILS